MFAMEATREPGDFARRGVSFEGPLAGRLLQHLHGFPERFRGRFLVVRLKRVERLLGDATHSRFDRAIAGLTFEALAMTLLRRRMIRNVRHNQI